MWTDCFVNISGGDGWRKPWLQPQSDGAACSTGVGRLHRQDASRGTLQDGDVATSGSWLSQRVMLANLSRRVMMASLSHVRRWFPIIASPSASPAQNICIVIFNISVCGVCVCVCVCVHACVCMPVCVCVSGCVVYPNVCMSMFLKCK